MNEKLNLNKKVQVEIASGEELLHNVYKPVVAKGRVERALFGLDGGSTQGRAEIIRRADENDGSTLGETYTIPSEMVISNDFKEIVPKGEELYHKMESIIVHNGPDTDQIFAKERVIRGSKLVESNKISDRVNSAISKPDTPAFYLNLVDTMAYALIMDSQRRGVPLAETYEVSAVVSLPPSDKNSERSSTKFMKNFVNPFNWTSIDLGVTFTLNVKNVYLTTEPGAAVRYISLIDDEIEPNSVVVGIDGGGRSIGIDVIEDGIAIDALSEAFNYGGTQLAQMVSDSILNKEGTRPREKYIMKAIETGFIDQGRTRSEVTDSVIAAKREMADNIYNDLMVNVFSKGKIDLKDVHYFIFTGRLFFRGEYNYSIADALMEKIRVHSPNVEFKIHTEGYPIPSGNLVYCLHEFGHEIEGNIDVSPLPYEEDDLEEEVASE